MPTDTPPTSLIPVTTGSDGPGGPSGWAVLDGARGLAVVPIVLYHALKVVGDWDAARVRNDGVPVFLWPFAGLPRLGVDLFFVLSGFLLAKVWIGRRRRHPHLGTRLREYARSRALRILPAYWVSLVVVVAWRAPELLASLDGLRKLGLLVTVQQYLNPALTDHVNVVYWSLTTEVHFYLLLPLLAVAVARRPKATLLATLAMSVVWFGVRGEWPSRLLPGRLAQFVAGLVAAAAVARHQAGARTRLLRALTARGTGIALAVALFAVGTYHGSTFGLPHGHWMDRLVHPLAGLIIAAAGLRLLCSPHPTGLRRLLERPVVMFFGAISYSLYLWHVPLLEAANHWAGDLVGPHTRLAGLLTLGIGLTASVGVAFVSYTFVEQPFMRRKSRRAARDGEVIVLDPSPGTREAAVAATS